MPRALPSPERMHVARRMVMRWMFEEGSLARVDGRLRRVGEWLLVGYTVALVLVTFVLPDRPPPQAGPGTAATIQLFVG